MGSTNYYNMFCVMGSPFLTCVHAQVKGPGLGQAKPSPALIEGCRLGLGFQQAPSPQKLSPAWGLKPKPGPHITTLAMMAMTTMMVVSPPGIFPPGPSCPLL